MLLEVRYVLRYTQVKYPSLYRTQHFRHDRYELGYLPTVSFTR